jgi:FtsP/CotA-like multicopper oxidase with cupredoxin domain
MHCHNLIHEDHAMMLRWDIDPEGGDAAVVP